MRSSFSALLANGIGRMVARPMYWELARLFHEARQAPSEAPTPAPKPS
ncbi:MAG TPA: hypothetical protein VMK32_01035 [Burkholderiaceae bacterium]|nr:hypothetical protein [Burkholderiaceae bacterium]